MMDEYDAQRAPDPEEWLELDEDQRVALVARYHRDLEEEVPNERLHASFHAIVETQLAMGIDYVVEALNRLLDEGLDRHDAIHAIGAVLVDQSYQATRDEGGADVDAEEAYARRLSMLTAKRWYQGDW